MSDRQKHRDVPRKQVDLSGGITGAPPLNPAFAQNFPTGTRAPATAPAANRGRGGNPKSNGEEQPSKGSGFGQMSGTAGGGGSAVGEKSGVSVSLGAAAMGAYNPQNGSNQVNFAPMTRAEFEEKGNITQSDIYSASSDRETQSTPLIEYTDPETGRTRYVAGAENIERFQRDVSPNIGPDNWRMRNIGEVQRDMVNGINFAARLTGVPATLLGAMAGIESTFGRNQMSPTGAEGIFQQTSGYLKEWYGGWEVRQGRRVWDDNRLNQVMPYLRQLAQHDRQVASIIADGRIDPREQDILSYNPAASAIVTAVAAQNLARREGFNLNDRRNWWMVYCEHNVGQGGLDAIQAGGRPAQWIINANPLFFRNGNPAQEYSNYVERWAQRYENTFSGPAPAIS